MAFTRYYYTERPTVKAFTQYTTGNKQDVLDHLINTLYYNVTENLDDSIFFESYWKPGGTIHLGQWFEITNYVLTPLDYTPDNYYLQPINPENSYYMLYEDEES